jgi:hypothetical protein
VAAVPSGPSWTPPPLANLKKNYRKVSKHGTTGTFYSFPIYFLSYTVILIHKKFNIIRSEYSLPHLLSEHVKALTKTYKEVPWEQGLASYVHAHMYAYFYMLDPG